MKELALGSLVSPTAFRLQSSHKHRRGAGGRADGSCLLRDLPLLPSPARLVVTGGAPFPSKAKKGDSSLQESCARLVLYSTGVDIGLFLALGTGAKTVSRCRKCKVRYVPS